MASITGREGSLLERALAIHEADIIVAPHGGQCFNLVFARPGTIFVEILPGMSATSACVHVLNTSRAPPPTLDALSHPRMAPAHSNTCGFCFLVLAGLKTSDGPYSVRSFASGLGLAMWVLHVRSVESTLLPWLRATSVPLLDQGRVSAS